MQTAESQTAYKRLPDCFWCWKPQLTIRAITVIKGNKKYDAFKLEMRKSESYTKRQ